MYIRCATNTHVFRSQSFIQSEAQTVNTAAVFMSCVLAWKLTAASITPCFTHHSIVHVPDAERTGFLALYVNCVYSNLFHGKVAAGTASHVPVSVCIAALIAYYFVKLIYIAYLDVQQSKFFRG